MRSLKHRRVVIATAALLVIGIASSAVAIAGRPGDQSRPVKRSTRTKAVKTAAHFAVFRRPSRPSDQLPPSRRATGAHKSATAITSRLLLQDGSDSVYAIDDGTGQLCLQYQDAASTFRANTCASTSQAAIGDPPLTLTMLQAAGSRVYMLLPDGISAVTSTAASSAQPTDVPVSGNVVRLPLDADAVSWRGLDGQTHKLDHLRPGVPPDVRKAFANQ